MREPQAVTISIQNYAERKAAGNIQITRHSPGVFTFAATLFDTLTAKPTTSPQQVTVSIEQIEAQLELIKKNAAVQVKELTVFLEDLKSEEAKALAASTE